MARFGKLMLLISPSRHPDTESGTIEEHQQPSRSVTSLLSSPPANHVKRLPAVAVSNSQGCSFGFFQGIVTM
jgi:hypothetical protein